ncbi:hypothetical protein T484DRAFT_1757334 [Baffinella frigidus]|nr:hypothetical protein T484DRAFT_1757334 [Cryptophyta sp. CCMP2293]
MTHCLTHPNGTVYTPEVDYIHIEFQNVFMKYLMKRREEERSELRHDWLEFDGLSDNFEWYAELDKDEKVAKGMNGRLHLDGMSLNQIKIKRDMYAAKLQDHVKKSDAEYMQDLIRSIKVTWCRGVTPVYKMVKCAIRIMDVLKILPATCTVVPNILSNQPTSESIHILSNWLCTHCDEFWVPENEDDVWEHLRYICSEIDGYPKKEARFVSRYTWENTQDYLNTTRHCVARPWNTDPNVSDDDAGK